VQLQFEPIADLPSDLVPDRLVRATVDWGGAPVLVHGAPASSRSEGAAVTVLRHDGSRWRTLLETETALVRPHAQPLPDGGVLLAGTRSLRAPDGRAELNGTVYDTAGTELRRVLLGDGIEDVQVTAAGAVWVSYLDAGTTGDFGSHGWGRLSPERWVEPVGTSGLVRFDLEGRREYELEPPPGESPAGDCFALNAGDAAVWISYHPGFPLVRLDGGGATAWRTGGVAADALAVSGNRVLRFAGYGVHRGTCWAGRLGEARELELEQVEVGLVAGVPLAAAHFVVGRHDALHAVTGNVWHRLELGTA